MSITSKQMRKWWLDTDAKGLICPHIRDVDDVHYITAKWLTWMTEALTTCNAVISGISVWWPDFSSPRCFGVNQDASSHPKNFLTGRGFWRICLLLGGYMKETILGEKFKCEIVLLYCCLVIDKCDSHVKSFCRLRWLKVDSLVMHVKTVDCYWQK